MNKEDAQLLEMLVGKQATNQSNAKINSKYTDHDSHSRRNDSDTSIGKTNSRGKNISSSYKLQKKYENPLDNVNITDESDDSDDITRNEKIQKREQFSKAVSPSKPKYLQEKEKRERTPPIKNEDRIKKRDRKEFTKATKHRQESDDELELPNLDHLGIKIEERNNQIIFDVSLSFLNLI
jgi:hypothetical protein